MRKLLIGMLALVAPVEASAQGAAQEAERIDEAALMRDLGALASDAMEGRGTGAPGAARARDYIERRWRELGLEVRRASFTYSARGRPPKPGVNVWTMIAGRGGDARGRGVIVIGAHYDHLGRRGGQIYNGADDNASGTAALLAIAAALRARPPEHDVILVAFDAEELGLHGARAFVAAPPVARERILLNLNLDMLARGDLGELWASGTRHYPALRPAVAAAAGAATIPVRLGQDIRPGERGEGREDWGSVSDHAAFAAAGIPYVFFSVENHGDYHRPTDDAERVQAAFYSGAVAAVLDTLRRLDGDGAALREARRAAGG
jgi:Zn-dependent M28 family amino/carboxypeptidase